MEASDIKAPGTYAVRIQQDTRLVRAVMEHMAYHVDSAHGTYDEAAGVWTISFEDFAAYSHPGALTDLRGMVRSGQVTAECR